MPKKPTPTDYVGAVVLLAIALGIVWGIVYLIFRFLLPPTPPYIALVSAAMIAYLAVCYFMKPPSFDPDEITFLNDPFTYEDDVQRTFFWVNIAMLPGIIAAHLLAFLVVRLFRWGR